MLIIDGYTRMQCHFFLIFKAFHTLLCFAIHRLKSHMEATYFLLTRDHMKCKRSRINKLIIDQHHLGEIV